MTTSASSLTLSSPPSLSVQSRSMSCKRKKNNFLLFKDNKPEQERFSQFYSTLQQYFNFSHFFFVKEKEVPELLESNSSDEDQENYFTPRSNFSNSVYSSITKGVDAQELEKKLKIEKKLLENEKFMVTPTSEFTVKSQLNCHLDSKNVASTSYCNLSTTNKFDKLKKSKKETGNLRSTHRVPFFSNYSRKSSVSHNQYVNTTHEDDFQDFIKMNCTTAPNNNNQNVMLGNNAILPAPINARPGISNLDQGFRSTSTASLNSLNSTKSGTMAILLSHQQVHNANVTPPLTRYAFSGDTATLPVGTSPLALQKRSVGLPFAPSQTILHSKLQKEPLLSQLSFNLSLSSDNKEHLAKDPSSPLISSRSRLALNMLNASTTAIVSNVITTVPTALNNVALQSSNGSSVGAGLNNGNGSIINAAGFQRQLSGSIKLRGGFEPHHLEPLQRYSLLVFN